MGLVADELRAAFVDRYRLESEIGRGGAAIVYLAEDLKHRRKVAVKVLNPRVAAVVGPERFLREIEISAQLNHPHILTLIDSGEAGSFLYYVMPFVDGESLRARLDRTGRLDVDEALHITREVAGGLHYAHERGIVHRDVKPANVLLAEGHAVLADFGIARAVSVMGNQFVTAPGLAMGTPAYMSPEQAGGELEVDARADIYALGCVVFEMLAGVPPYQGSSPRAIVTKHFNDPVPSLCDRRPEIGEALDAAVRQALAKDPEDRFPTAAAFAAALHDGDTPFPLGRLAPHLIDGAPARTKSIAVLPFANLSADPENEYFSDGITEEIINALGHVPSLGVAARTSSFAFKGKDTDVRDVGRKLQVDAVLEGSVRRAGNRIRITAQLVDAENGYHLWSERFDREMVDVFVIQDEIARAIVEQLKVEFVRDSDSPLVKQQTSNLDAYNLHLKGRYFWVQREQGLAKGLECFRQAIQLDPGFAPAHAGLADSYLLLGFYGFEPPAEVFPPARDAAERALQLDGRLADAHASLAFVKMLYYWEWQEAEREFVHAIQLNPGYATAHHWYSEYLSAMGRFDEAIAAARRAQQLDPLGLIINTLVAMAYYLARDYDRAIDEARRTLELQPEFLPVFIWLAVAYQQAGRHDEAVEVLERGRALSGDRPQLLALLGQTYGMAGRRREAARVVERLQELGAQRYVSPVDLARVRIGLGEHEAALRELERAVEERASWLAWVGVEPAFDPVRSDPVFRGLIQRLRLPLGVRR